MGTEPNRSPKFTYRPGNGLRKTIPIDESIRHKLRAGDVNGVAQLVEHNGQTMLNSDRWYIFEKTHSGDRFFHLL